MPNSISIRELDRKLTSIDLRRDGEYNILFGTRKLGKIEPNTSHFTSYRKTKHKYRKRNGWAMNLELLKILNEYDSDITLIIKDGRRTVKVLETTAKEWLANGSPLQWLPFELQWSLPESIFRTGEETNG